MIKHICMAAVLAMVFAVAASGRPVRMWSYEDLLKESDLVVIAAAQSVTEVQIEPGDRPLFAGGWTAQVTTFTVNGVIKGDLEGNELRVLHYKDDDVSLPNGPQLVTFRREGMLIESKGFKAQLGPPEYLLFLKRDKEGRYEPVSGQMDPVMSVREMHPPIPMGAGQSPENPPAAYLIEPRTKAIRTAFEAATKIVEIPPDAVLEVIEDERQIVVTWKLTGVRLQADYAAKVFVDRKSGAVKQILVGS